MILHIPVIGRNYDRKPARIGPLVNRTSGLARAQLGPCGAPGWRLWAQSGPSCGVPWGIDVDPQSR